MFATLMTIDLLNACEQGIGKPVVLAACTPSPIIVHRHSSAVTHDKWLDNEKEKLNYNELLRTSLLWFSF